MRRRSPAWCSRARCLSTRCRRGETAHAAAATTRATAKSAWLRSGARVQSSSPLAACLRQAAGPSSADLQSRRPRIAMTFQEEVDYVSGRTRVFGIVGHPIEQVRSPEMFTAEFRRRDATRSSCRCTCCLRISIRVPAAAAALRNLDGLVFTIPYKVRACALAEVLGAQARVVGAINALTRAADGRWQADIFDGLGCVEAFRRRGDSASPARRVMLLGAGGAGSAIAVAIALRAAGRTARLRRRCRARAAALADQDRARAIRRRGNRRDADDRRTSTSCSTRRRSACWATRACRVAGRHAAARTRRVRRDREARDARRCWHLRGNAAARRWTAAR